MGVSCDAGKEIELGMFQHPVSVNGFYYEKKMVDSICAKVLEARVRERNNRKC